MDGYWVEYDGGAVLYRHRNASRIRVAPNVAVIPAEAFLRCDNLKEVDLSNVTTISHNAFYKCRSLKRVVRTSAHAVEIGVGAFQHCNRLEEINVGNATIGAGAFAGCWGLREIGLSNAATIGPSAFEDCGLTRVSIPLSVAEIEEGAFQGCECLMDVELADGIQRIGIDAFAGCESLVRINVPPSVTHIGDRAFRNYVCRLEEVELNEGLQRIGDYAFQCTTLLRIRIPSTTTKIGDNAFAYCRELSQAKLQEGLQVIGAGAFRYCVSLGQITIPSSVMLVGSGVFQNCSDLTEVVLCEGIHLIDSDAFDGCNSLERMNIPPVALVIDIEGSSCELLQTSKLRPTPERRLVVSKWMQCRSPSQLAQAEAKVNEILARRRQPEGQKVTLIREWFAYLDLLDVTTMLELAIWRANMNGNEQDADAKQARRRDRGSDMNVIIPGVLPFLEL